MGIRGGRAVGLAGVSLLGACIVTGVNDDEAWDLTPEYDADHDDHFHVDLTPDGSFYE